MENYLLNRYEDLTRKMRTDITQSQYELLYYQRKEIAMALIKGGVLDHDELNAYRDGIDAKITLERQGH